MLVKFMIVKYSREGRGKNDTDNKVNYWYEPSYGGGTWPKYWNNNQQFVPPPAKDAPENGKTPRKIMLVHRVSNQTMPEMEVPTPTMAITENSEKLISSFAWLYVN